MRSTLAILTPRDERAATFAELRKETIAALKQHIDAGWLTERQFARIAKISQPHINNIFKGRRKPGIELLDQLCRAARIDRTGKLLD